MNDHTENLLDVLEKEFEAYEDLEGILLKEREVLRRPKFANFEEQIGLKAEVVHRIRALEQERTRLMAVLSSEQGQDTKNLHLIDLVRNTPPPLAKRFMNVRGRLRETTDRVKQVTHGEVIWDRKYLSPIGNREFIARMVRNLKNAYLGQKDRWRALRMMDWLVVAQPGVMQERRDRGFVNYELGNYSEALDDLRAYFASSSSIGDGEVVRGLITRIEAHLSR